MNGFIYEGRRMRKTSWEDVDRMIRQMHLHSPADQVEDEEKHDDE